MKKTETYKIVLTIESLFNNHLTRNYKGAVDAEKDGEEAVMVDITNTYHDFLKTFDFEAVKQNLIVYSLGNSFAPKIADLVKGLNNNVTDPSNTIPNVAATKEILDEKYKRVPKEQQLSKQQINDMLIKTIGRGLKNL